MRPTSGPRRWLGFTVACWLAAWALGGEARADELAGLSRVRFHQGGEVRSDIGELSYEDGRVLLKLFSERLGAHYVVYLTPEDLVDIEIVPAAEAERIQGERELVRAAKERERETARAARAAAKKAEAARTPAGSGSRARPGKGATPSNQRERGTSAGGAVRELYLPPIEETIADLEQVQRGIAERAGRVRSEVESWVGRLDLPHAAPRSAVATARRELLGVLAELDEINERLAGRARDLEGLYQARDDRSLTRAVAVDMAELGHRRLEPIERLLKAAEARNGELGKSVGALLTTMSVPVEEAASAAPAVAPAAGAGRPTVTPPAVAEARVLEVRERETTPARTAALLERVDGTAETPAGGSQPTAVGASTNPKDFGNRAGMLAADSLRSGSAAALESEASARAEDRLEADAPLGVPGARPAVYWVLGTFGASVLGFFLLMRRSLRGE